MAQSGLHIPVDIGSRMPVFKSLFADIGDEQSISASLSTFSAHITNIVSMDRALTLPALVLVDEIGAGTDPVEGGALGIAVIDHFRKRGAHLIATTHYDSLKSYASTTEGVVSAAFGFKPETFAPTYRLSLRIAGSQSRHRDRGPAGHAGQRHRVRAGEPERPGKTAGRASRARGRGPEATRGRAAARSPRSGRRSPIPNEPSGLARSRFANANRPIAVVSMPSSTISCARGRREIDSIIEGLKAKTTELSQQAARGRAAGGMSTGEAGSARADARAALEQVVGRLKTGTESGRRRRRTRGAGPDRAWACG